MGRRYVVYSRAWQAHVQAQMYHQWLEQDEGKQWHKHVVNAYKEVDPRNPPSSTYFNTKMKQHYKTHNHNTYGGELWLKILIAMGDIPQEAVNLANILAARKVDHKYGAGASTPSDGALWPKGPEPHWHERDERARMPPPTAPSAKRRRKAAEDMLKKIEEDYWKGKMDSDTYEFRRARAVQLRTEAYELSKAYSHSLAPRTSDEPV